MKNKYTKIFSKVSVLVVLVVAFTFGLCEPVHSASKPILGTANSFAVLAGSGITVAGAVNSSTINGDIGTYSTTTITGLGNVVLNGTNHAGDGVTQTAKTDLTTAYLNAESQAPATTNYPAIHDLGGETLLPGIYKDPSSFGITGTLTLDGGGNPDAVFIFQAGSTLITAGSSIISLTNGAQARNVFWQVGSSATLGTSSTFKGNILALTSITLTTGANIEGRMLARNGAVTLDTNTIMVPTTLTLNKTVTNDNGGTALNTEWTLSTIAPSPTIISGVTGNVNVTNAAVAPGAYTLSESGGPSGYTASTYSCVKNGGGAVASNSITLTVGDNAVCTITNDDNAPSLTLNKIVVNDNSGVASESEWTLTATGPTTISGAGAAGSTDVVSGASFDQGTYTLSESAGPAGYAASSWSCTNGITVNGSRQITLGLGQTTVCTITNNDIAPSAATLYIIKHVITDNGGTADASDFTINVTGTNVSDPSFTGEESPGTTITLDAGSYSVDENAFSGYTKSLGANCSGTIAAGDTKTCTITNDDNADTESDETDDEDVDEDVDIKVTKKASPEFLPLGSGLVIYTYKVTNEGDVSLHKISVKDNKCSPVKFVSGDKDHDSRLDTNETWKYTCTKIVSKTETNEVIAKGTANGDRVKDTDKTIVVVSAPGFPNAGVGPDDKNNNLWNNTISRIFSLFHFSSN